jgi:hypothetical protein
VLIPVFCECGSLACKRRVEIESDDYSAIQNSGCIVVAAGCDTIPGEGDRFVADRGTYQVWTNGEKQGGA